MRLIVSIVILLFLNEIKFKKVQKRAQEKKKT